jgi:hypothetical protein
MTTTPRRDNWHARSFFGLHFDLHPNAEDTELGTETTYAHIRRELEKVKPDFVQYDCKGHPGYAGYPTKIGVPSPGVRGDALKVWRKVTRDLGIPLSVHYSGTWDEVQWRMHPEWARRKVDGTPWGGAGFNPHALAADSPYDEQLLIPQLIEVIDRYDIDGVWVDGECWAAAPDWSEGSRRLFTEHTGITDIPLKPEDAHWEEWLLFHRRRFEAHITRYADALHTRKPAFAVCSNWAYTVRMPDEITAPVDYLSGDFVWAFGLESAMLEAKFMESRGMTWDLMAWGFTTAGPMSRARWTTKAAEHLQLEGAIVAANGGAYFIYDTPARSGKLIDWHMDVFADVATFMRRRQKTCQNATSAPHVALLHSQSHFYASNGVTPDTASVYNTGTPERTLIGALELLMENHYHVDVMNEDALLRRMDAFPVIVVAEQTHLPQALRAALVDWARRGGKLLLTGAHVAHDFADVIGASAIGEPEDASYCVPADGGAVPIGGAWQRVKLRGAREMAKLLRRQDISPRTVAGPSATIKRVGQGSIAAIHGPIATFYADYRYGRIRSYFGAIMRELAGEMPVELDAPSHVRMVVRQKPDQTLVHLINTLPANVVGPQQPLIESVARTGPITLKIKTNRPKRVSLEPDKKGLTWKWNKGVLTATIESLHIHSALVVS